MALLEIRGLTKRFGDIVAVDGIDMDVAKGEVLGLLGPNGAGKSTTISMIATLRKPDSGTIRFDGEDILTNPGAIRPRLGYVPQEVALYPMLTGRENLAFWGRAYGLSGKALKDRIEEAAEIIGISARLKDQVKKYSGGMKRRLNIGAALLHHPDFLIMDEPTVGIDPQSRNHILETVRTLADTGMTILYTSHYMEEVEKLCERILIMDMGRIIAGGTREELIALVGDAVEMRVRFTRTTPGLSEKLSRLEGVTRAEVQDQEAVLLLSAEDNAVERVLKLSQEEGIAIQGLDIERPDLEAVFLHLTGRELRD